MIIANKNFNDLCYICLNVIKEGENTVSDGEIETMTHASCWLKVKESELKIRRKNKCKNKLR